MRWDKGVRVGRIVDCSSALALQMYRAKLENDVKLDDVTARQQQIANQLCTGILVKAQMLIVQNRRDHSLHALLPVPP